MSVISKIKALVFQHGDKTEATAFPFWYVAVKGGALLRRPVMVSHGIWFSREAAEEHLRAKAYRYPKTAFVYCDSAHDSPTGLRGLMETLKDALEPRDQYQDLLAKIADAAGISGSPTFDEVVERVKNARRAAEKFKGYGDISSTEVAWAVLDAFDGRES